MELVKSNSKENLIVVASPFQLISALEAIYHFRDKERNGKENYHVLVFLSKHDNTNKLMLSLIEQFTLGILCEFSYIRYTNEFSFLWRKLKFISKNRKIGYNKLMVGHLDEFSIKLLICNLKFAKLFSLDDGAATLTINNRIKEYDFYLTCFNSLRSVNNFIKYIMVKVFSLQKSRNVVVNWFTVFDFIPNNNGEVYTHQFQFLRRNFNSDRIGNHGTLFIGANLVNAGVVKSLDKYKELLINIFKQVEGIIYYVPHRYEDISLLDDVFSLFDVQVVKGIGMIEIFLLQQDLYPSRIISFYSTALYTLSKLFPTCEVLFVEIPTPVLNKSFVNKVRVVEKYYSERFQVLNV